MSNQVWLGGAHIDERGQATGGAAGDQTGRELSVSRYYTHKLGWRVFRSPNVTSRGLIADAMLAACDNPHIGYDQSQRDTLYKAAAKHGFDPALVTTDVETDCSALVRVCCAYAGYRLPNIRTASEPQALLKAGFAELVLNPDQLQRGDILCTPAAGHTEIVVRVDGQPDPEREEDKMDTIRRGSKSYQVKVMQQLLRMWGCVIAVDGDCGPRTEQAIMAFQSGYGLTADGVCGPRTWAALLRGE